MTPPWVGWLPILFAMGAAPTENAPKIETVTLAGKFAELTKALQPLGLTLDTEPIAKQVVLVGDNGSITPLLSDDASRALFLDERLRDRRGDVKVRRFPGLPYVQVVSFRVLSDGKLRIPEYYCEICTISVRYPQTCPCCQGPMVLRMKPEAP